MTAQSSRQRGPSVPRKGSQMIASREEFSFHCYSRRLLMRKTFFCCLLSHAWDWGTRQASSPGSKDVLEGALPVLIGHLCPTATAVSRSQVPYAIRGMVPTGNQNQDPAVAKPLPSASSFTCQTLQQSPGNHSAWEALKICL